MDLKGFRELILKKIEDNSLLKSTILSISDEAMADKVVEALEKMARANARMGESANAAVVGMANRLTNKDVEMMRDALGHHVSSYRAALKAGNRDVADQHLNKIIPMMHLVARMAPHSNGMIALDYIPTEAWESNYTRLTRNPKNGKLQEGTKGLGRRTTKTKVTRNPYAEGHEKHSKQGAYSVPDYRYLEMSPHPGHKDYANLPHEGGYPFEEIQLGSSANVDKKEAHLPIKDIESPGKFVPHAFDEHPIHPVTDHSQHELLHDSHDMNSFIDNFSKWHDSDHIKKWMQRHREQHASDPEQYKSRGKVKPQHVFEGLKIQDPEHHVTAHVESFGKQPKTVARGKEQSSAAPQAPVLKPTSTPSKPAPAVDYSALPEGLRSKLGIKG
jgi:hypothetical protein